MASRWAIPASGMVVCARTAAASFTLAGSPLHRAVKSASVQPSAWRCLHFVISYSGGCTTGDWHNPASPFATARRSTSPSSSSPPATAPVCPPPKTRRVSIAYIFPLRPQNKIVHPPIGTRSILKSTPNACATFSSVPKVRLASKRSNRLTFAWRVPMALARSACVIPRCRRSLMIRSASSICLSSAS